MPLRIAFIGCVESSQVALQSLLALPGDVGQVVGVVTRRGSSFNSDFVDLSPLARDAGVPLLYVEEAASDEQQAAWLNRLDADLAFCVGWSKLLGPRVLGAVPRGVVGFHPAALPANRGRHPLIWALALGLDETASSFFFMRAEADSGPLVSQQTIPISRSDDARTLYGKVMEAVRAQVAEVAIGLASDTLQPREQDHSGANHWRRRGVSDGQIDWRMSAESVYNLVRALTRPYPGAHFMHGEQMVKVWRSRISVEGGSNIEPGKVLNTDGARILVKCGSQSLWLLEHEWAALPCIGDYV